MEINKSNVNVDYNIVVQGENNKILLIDSNNKNHIHNLIYQMRYL